MGQSDGMTDRVTKEGERGRKKMKEDKFGETSNSLC